jgi:hypothetical protein
MPQKEGTLEPSESFIRLLPVPCDGREGTRKLHSP